MGRAFSQLDALQWGEHSASWMPYNGESIQPAGCLTMGRAFSQLDAPFSLAISRDRFCLAGSVASNSVTHVVSIALRCGLRARFFSSY